MPELAYVRCGDYEVPNLKLSNPTDVPIGKYGRMRKHYPTRPRPLPPSPGTRSAPWSGQSRFSWNSVS